VVIIDTSAWIEFFRPSGNLAIKKLVRYALENESVGIGDLIYCEILQGTKNKDEFNTLKHLLDGLSKFDMVGFSIAEKSAENYRNLRSRGITVRKTIDVLIATFCMEHDYYLIHNDSDFDLIKSALPLETFGN